MNSPVIWTSFEPELLIKRQRHDDSARIIIGKPSRPDPTLAEADIAFGQPNPEQLLELPRLKWVHVSSAGYTPYDRDDLRAAFRSRGAVLTNSSSVFDEPCAQHALAMMLSLARKLPESLKNQQTTHGWPVNDVRSGSRLLKDQTVLIVGFGAIGTRLAELLAPFHLNIIAFRRQPRGDEKVRCVKISELDQWLPRADHVVNILPASPSSNELFNTARFSKMHPTANFYNIGRGTTVDQTALRAALEAKQIAAAYLDVTTPEPLPPSDPLWTTPNCYITPHTAGGHTNEFERVVDHFLENLKRYQNKMELLNQVF